MCDGVRVVLYGGSRVGLRLGVLLFYCYTIVFVLVLWVLGGVVRCLIRMSWFSTLQGACLNHIPLIHDG